MNQQRTPGKQSGLSVLGISYLILFAALFVAAFWVYKNYSYPSNYLLASAYQYPVNYSPACVGKLVQQSTNNRADHLKVKLDENRAFSLTTPSNYRNDFAHPLLMVWAPAGFSENFSERFTGLTAMATERGFVVAYARSIPLGKKALVQLDSLVVEIKQTWCIDEEQVFYTGHSDGGTVSNALAVMQERSSTPRAIAPSALGMQGSDMAEFVCPKPTALMLMHNLGDGHFPDYGEGVADWWSQCNGCSPQREASAYPMCQQYVGCQVTTLFCQADGGHGHWPGIEHKVLEFFDKQRLTSSEKPQ